MTLSAVHYIYLVIMALIVLTMCLKRDVLLLCILGSGIVGFVYTKNIIEAIQIIYRSVLVSGREFIEMIIIISLVNGMSKSLKDAGADEMMMAPIKKIMINRTASFFVLGITMLLVSWFIWPTPAAVFVGSIMVPAAVNKGLPPVWCGVALNIFGNGMALSSDYFIQAAPSITGKTAGIADPYEVIRASFLIWIIMSITVVGASFIFMIKDLKTNRTIINNLKDSKAAENIVESTKGSRVIAIVTPVAFFIDLIILYTYKIKGKEATAIIVGTSMLIMILASLINFKFKNSLSKVAIYIRDGFTFGIKVFAPIIIIGAFFYMGSRETGQEILGIEAKGFLTDVGIYLSEKLPLSKFSVLTLQASVSAMLGLGGSGFAGLPLIGTLAQVFETATNISRASLAALGQIITIWVGGGTIIPWRIATIAAICNVEPFEIAKKNLLPVCIGIIVIVIVSIIIL